ncbi:MAG: hypothetical protein HRT88_23850 [Lentisphaeraceae bacterium]|nr:hypothetical protein [Lentisphaeraceae bacterium]
MKKTISILGALFLSTVTGFAHPGHSNTTHVHLSETTSVDPMILAVMITAIMALGVLFHKNVKAFK